MRCLRCGNRIPDGSVFCAPCLEKMQSQPVAPGTPVQLPRRESRPAVKKPKKPEQTPEEQIAALRKSKKRLIRWVAILCLMLGLLCGALYMSLQEKRPAGQNYRIDTGMQTTGAP